ncbi:MAG: TfoX/Sxy family protein [Rhodomicrobium sp.]
MQDAPVKHDKKLFEALLGFARAIDPDVRGGSMFGCPAAFHGRKMAACVYGDKIGLKVPEEQANATLASGRAVPFTPYGKAKMREWIMLEGGELDKIGDLLASALAYAEANNTKAR